jgi:glucose/arabinose dehydrogenase
MVSTVHERLPRPRPRARALAGASGAWLLLSACGAAPTTAPPPDAAPPAAAGAVAASPPAGGEPTGRALAVGTAAPPAAPDPSEVPATDPTEAAAALTRLPVDPATLSLDLAQVAGGLDRPVELKAAGDGSGRLFVGEKAGTVRVLADGALLEAPFLDIRDRVGSRASEQGLLGLAFHPQHGRGGERRFYVNYTDRSGDTVVAEYRVTEDPNRADPASERVLLRAEQPAANHNGGNLVFGPDGYLYIGLGDGGGAGDRFGNGQNPDTLLGKMLRLDVAGEPYRVPADNPFVDRPGWRPEIWAYGLRNPWRYSFDRATGDLYIADVGQGQWEEVNRQAAGSRGGENYGWPNLEGDHCYRGDGDCEPAGGSIHPIVEYSHDEGGCSISGGHVYRGAAQPALHGIYLFGDYCSGLIWGAAPLEGGWRRAQLAGTGLSISTFGEDEAGEVYVADMAGGGIYRLVARPAVP